MCAGDHERRVIACLQCVKCLNSGLVERNAAVAAGGFGAVLDLQFIGAHLIAAFVPVGGDNAVFINIQGSGCEIDIRPLECQCFAHPQTGIQDQKKGIGIVIERFAALVFLPQFPPQDLDLGRREGLDLFGAFGGRRENDAKAGIAGNDVADQGVAIAGIECVIDLLDTGIGQMCL